jgi:two-component system sensor histidine kinase YesM
VENAIQHGLQENPSGGFISINIEKCSSGSIRITVTDNGKGISKEDLDKLNSKLTSLNDDGQNIGLLNICKRIKYMYSDDYGITVESTENAGTSVIIHLPVS